MITQQPSVLKDFSWNLLAQRLSQKQISAGLLNSSLILNLLLLLPIALFSAAEGMKKASIHPTNTISQLQRRRKRRRRCLRRSLFIRPLHSTLPNRLEQRPSAAYACIYVVVCSKWAINQPLLFARKPKIQRWTARPFKLDMSAKHFTIVYSLIMYISTTFNVVQKRRTTDFKTL